MTFLFHLIDFFLASSSASLSESIPINSQSKSIVLFINSNHKPVPQPRSTILFGLKLEDCEEFQM